MRRLGPIIALFLLVPAAPAAAKGVSAAQLCGPSGCVDVVDHNALQAFHEGGNVVDPPSAGAPWYRARVTVHAEDASDTFGLVVVPALRLIRSGDQYDGEYMWTPISAEAAGTLGDAAAGLEPFPGSELVGTTRVRRTKASADEAPLPEDPNEDDGGVSAAAVGGVGAALLIGAGALGLRRHRRNGRA